MCVRTVMAGRLYGFPKSACCFVPPRCASSLSLLCNHVQWVSCAGFKVLRTNRLEDTQILYGKIQEQLQELYGSLPRGGTGGAERLLTFQEWRTRCKHATCPTVRDVWTQMLISVQGPLPWPAAAACMCRMHAHLRRAAAALLLAGRSHGQTVRCSGGTPQGCSETGTAAAFGCCVFGPCQLAGDLSLSALVV